MSSETWYARLDLSKLDDDDRFRILEYVVNKVGRVEVQNTLSISRITMWRLLNRQARVDDSKLKLLLNFLSEQEFRDILSSKRILEALNILRTDGTVNYPVVMEILKKATEDEYLKQLIIKFVVDNFREDVKKAVGLFPANIELKWEKGFEEFLREHKKRRKVRRQDTIEYYRKLFIENLEGKQLTPQLIDFVINYRNEWLRNIFRHYIQYLYFRRKIPLETYGWIMEVVPSRTYENKVRIFKIDLELFKKTMDFLRENHELYHLYYLIMYYSGIRLEHVVKLVETYSPDEIVYVEMLDEYTSRLICFENFCRYYLGLKGGKPCEWVYFPKELVSLLEKHKGTRRDRAAVSKYALRKQLLRPKYLRKLHWRIGKKAIRDKDTLRFIQSRFGELKISEEKYGDLLADADSEYPKLADMLKKGLQNPNYLRNLLLGGGVR
mgnify:CR=1 FL=1